MKGSIRPGADKEQMKAYVESLSSGESGTAKAGGRGGAGGVESDDDDGCPRGWIINGCYWCGTDVCVNPGWVGTKCPSCGGYFLITR